jgi:hypothetical protein
MQIFLQLFATSLFESVFSLSASNALIWPRFTVFNAARATSQTTGLSHSVGPRRCPTARPRCPRDNAPETQKLTWAKRVGSQGTAAGTAALCALALAARVRTPLGVGEARRSLVATTQAERHCRSRSPRRSPWSPRNRRRRTSCRSNSGCKAALGTRRRDRPLRRPPGLRSRRSFRGRTATRANPLP